MVGIRSMGLALESVIGFENAGKQFCMVPEYQLRNLVEISNHRFSENTKRIERFRSLLKEIGTEVPQRRGKDGEEWEDAKARRERKRAEGLKKAAQLKNRSRDGTTGENPDIGFLEQNP